MKKTCLFGCVLLILAGCQSALLETRRENKRLESRIYQKEAQLQDIEQDNSVLKNEINNLVKDIESKKLSIDDLLAKLSIIRTENNKRSSDVHNIQQNKYALESRLIEYQKALQTIKNEVSATQQEKEKRIEALKKEIALYLQLGLN